MPQHSLEEAKFRLQEAFALIDTRIDQLEKTEPDGSLRDRLLVAREGVRDALKRVEHAEEAISGQTDESCGDQR